MKDKIEKITNFIKSNKFKKALNLKFRKMNKDDKAKLTSYPVNFDIAEIPGNDDWIVFKDKNDTYFFVDLNKSKTYIKHNITNDDKEIGIKWDEYININDIKLSEKDKNAFYLKNL